MIITPLPTPALDAGTSDSTIRRLREESADFRAAWDRHEVVAHRSKREEFLNRHVGRITVDHTDLWLGPDVGPRMVTYVPADEESRRRLERLHALASARRPA